MLGFQRNQDHVDRPSLKSAYHMYKYLEKEYNIINNNKVPDLYDRLKNLRAKTDKEVIKFTTVIQLLLLH